VTAVEKRNAIDALCSRDRSQRATKNAGPEALAGARNLRFSSQDVDNADRPGSSLKLVCRIETNHIRHMAASAMPAARRIVDRVRREEAAGSYSASAYFFFGAAFFGAAFFGAAFVGAALAGAALGLASGFAGALFLAGSDFFTAIGLTSFQDILACVRPA
jgi:hypothetical protein